MIKAIDTVYKGYKFRSRLEARWAVFFDKRRLKWEYEPQGFKLPSGPYLPDFHMPDFDSYVEIKPAVFDLLDQNTRERKLASELADSIDGVVVIFCGDPLSCLAKVKTRVAVLRPSRHKLFDEQGGDAETSLLHGIQLRLAQFGIAVSVGAAPAALAARQARFEHGELP